MAGTYGRKIGKGALLLGVLWILFTAALSITAMIPQHAFRPAMEANARYFGSADLFEKVTEGQDPAIIHNYADAMLFNLIWAVDSTHPLSSVLTAPYYYGGGDGKTNIGQSLEHAVFHGAGPNRFYGRYWHGTSVLVRPLSLVMDIHGIRVLNAAVLGGLALLFGILLCRRKLYALLAGYLLSILLCKTYAIPLCMEYMSCFVIMLVFGSLVLGFYERIRDWDLWFLAAGAVTCYLDFLTCEILTLFVPLLCLLRLRYGGKKKVRLQCFWDIVRTGGIWLTGYGLTFLCKWLLASAISGKSLEGVALKQGLYRIAGNFYEPVLAEVPGTVRATGPVTPWQGLDAVLVNMGRVWPMNLAPTAVYITHAILAVAVVLLAAWFLFRKREQDSGLVLPFLFLACMPVLRWMVLSNHSLGHAFFTFRDWFILLMAVAGVMGEGLDWSFFQRRGSGTQGEVEHGTHHIDAMSE